VKPPVIELPDGTRVPILYEDRSVLAIDKPTGWMLAPATWKNTSRNLQRELMISIQCGEYWARSRNLKFVRYIHRLDAETSGVLLLGKSAGAVSALSELFESRLMGKKYLAVVHGIPKETSWVCRLGISEGPGAKGQMRVDERHGKEAETAFHVLERGQDKALVEAAPRTGRTHQIRVHLAAAGHPVLGDSLYGGRGRDLALRAIELSYTDPFQKRPVRILAPTEEFRRRFHFTTTR
jgi:RluA family pseudouridine synthase